MDKSTKLYKRDAVLKTLEKAHGKGVAGVYGLMSHDPVSVVPTGSVGLDAALGVGGYPRGRIIEIWGAEASGKTTMMLHAIAEAQKLGGMAAFVDAEHALDPIYAANLGVDMDSLIVSQPDYGEQALDVVEELVKSEAFDIIVIDSVAALTPKDEIDGDVGDYHVGKQARMMSQACRKLTPIVSKTKTVLVFINQVRSKIGVTFGPKTTTTGGNALKYYASVRLEVSRVATLKKGEEATGSRTKIKVAKNKVAPPFKTCEFDIVYGKGISKVGEITDAALNLAIFEKAGAWYSYEGTTVAQGRDNLVQWLVDNPDTMAKLEAVVRQELKLAPSKAEASDD